MQPGLDLRAARFEEWRQGQLLAEVRGILIGGEAGAIGRDLEENATEFTEIERLEVEPIDHRCDTETGRGDPALPRFMSSSLGVRNET